MNRDWVCCQIGAREHYAIPRALHLAQELEHLLTDCWVSPGSPHSLAGNTGLRDRYHPDLATASISSWTLQSIFFEANCRLRRRHGWDRTLRRNDWFQTKAIAELAKLPPAVRGNGRTLFSYSYASSRLFDYAKAKGWRTILGQIDPGPAEERIIGNLHKANPSMAGTWQPAPEEYWQNWRAECALADAIIVNSSWSRRCLEAEGIPAKKLKIVPLAFEPRPATPRFERKYPRAFSPSRPLRVLFLGQVNLRKGSALLLEAAQIMQEVPIEFWMVGEVQVTIPAALQSLRTIKWFGACPRSGVDSYYRGADVFVLPTLSDGFGLTQLEARKWQLPLIVSRHCGEVVTDRANGIVLAEPSTTNLVSALRFCADHPENLKQWAEESNEALFGMAQLREALLSLR